MKRIVCFGDSNTWGYNARTMERFSEDVRWSYLLGKLLGDGYQVIEEGLNGRTAVVDDPLFEGLNGYKYIYPCLMSHSPLELVIIMLGTNDTKERFNLTSYNIAQGITRLALKVKGMDIWAEGKPPKIVVVSPPPIEKEYYYTEVGLSMGKGCDIKSERLSEHLSKLLEPHDMDLLDTKGIIPMNKIDYMHLDEEGHKLLSKYIFDRVKNILY